MYVRVVSQDNDGAGMSLSAWSNLCESARFAHVEARFARRAPFAILSLLSAHRVFRSLEVTAWFAHWFGSRYQTHELRESVSVVTDPECWNRWKAAGAQGATLPR